LRPVEIVAPLAVVNVSPDLRRMREFAAAISPIACS